MFMLIGLQGCVLEEFTQGINLDSMIKNERITQADMVNAIRQALNNGSKQAVAYLGKENGFNNNAEFRIPLPEELDKIALLLRKLGQGEKVDAFIHTLNQGAEKAVTRSYDIFSDAIQSMSIADGVTILKGADDSATRYFREKTQSNLEQRFLPVIQSATQQVGVTREYKKLTALIPSYLKSSLNIETPDIDAYILERSIDALFVRIAVEEQAIRKDPVKRTTALLEKVFGYYSQ
ncbi:MAG: DUF4197 domain-containing protein [Gammaproteobacteria bacterium]|nr:DUF4197 domain-containing protein [Gammaproteobacteria bacterium]